MDATRFVVALSMLGLLGSAQLAGAIPTAGLVGYWQANGDATDSAGGHNGSLKNGVSFVAGVEGQAFRLDGANDVVSIPHSSDLQPTAITVAAWIKTTSNSLQVVADKSHGFLDQTGWALQLIGGRVSFAYGNGSSFPELTSTSVLSDGLFHHVAATLDGPGGTIRLFIDGAQQPGTVAYVSTPAGNGRPIHLGASFGGDLTYTNYVRPFNGIIDEVAIYSRALNVSEVADLLNNPGISLVPEPGAYVLMIAGLGKV